MRYRILDGFRGFFLIFMAVVHINSLTDVYIGKINHHYLGWVEDAQGFIFISGLVVGLHYGKIMVLRSYNDMSTAIWHRIRTIYSHQIGLIGIFFVSAILLAAIGLHPRVLQPYTGEGGATFLFTSMFLVSGSMHMGILPMYIYFMALSPLLMKLFHLGYALPVAILSVWAWFVAQTGLMDVAETFIENTAAGAGYEVSLGIFFNVLGWQVIFYGGLYGGYMYVSGNFNLSFLKNSTFELPFFICVSMLVFFAIFDRLVFWELISDSYSYRFLQSNERGDFSLIYLINFVVMLYVIAWMIVAGPKCGIRAVECICKFAVWVFTRGFLVFLGRHSLHVFSFHLLLVYTMYAVLGGKVMSEMRGSIVLVMGVASIYLAAFGHAWLQRRFPSARSAAPASPTSLQERSRQMVEGTGAQETRR